VQVLIFYKKVQFIADSGRKVSRPFKNALLHHIANAPNCEFSCIDNNLHCYKENKDCKEAIFQQTAAKHQKASTDQ
jgi:hypothetical protein